MIGKTHYLTKMGLSESKEHTILFDVLYELVSFINCQWKKSSSNW